jgi:hypothetical protein
VGRSGSFDVAGSPTASKFRILVSGDSTMNAGAGDVIADGVVDLIAGAYYGAHAITGADRGKVGVIFGRRMGDVDLDADIDLADFQYWTICMNGPTDAELITGSQVFDFNHDGRVGLSDFGGFQDTFAE